MSMARKSGETSHYNKMALFLFIFFLIPVMPLQEKTSPPLSPRPDTAEFDSNFAKKSNLTNLKTPQRNGTTTEQEASTQRNAIPVTVQHGRAYKSLENQGLKWRDGAINASAHEVPSGTNPISNR